MRTFLTTYLFLVVIQPATYGQSLDKARVVAQSFASKLHAGGTVAFRSEREGFWEFESKGEPITVAKFGTYITLWMQGKSTAAHGPKPIVKNEARARQIAQAWAKKVAIPLDPVFKVHARTQNLNDGSQIVKSYIVECRDRPFPNYFGLNTQQIFVNAMTGEVETYSARQGVTYDKPVVTLSKSAAIHVARRRVAEVYRGVKTVDYKVTQLALASDGGISEFRVGKPVLWAKRRARLAYFIEAVMPDPSSRSHSLSVVVDAETGRVLDGGIGRPIRKPSPSERGK